MRFTHLLVGLVGLATLSVAAPAPGREINIPAGAELGKVKVCDGLGQQGTCKDIQANMACVELESPIKYNLISIVQDKGNLCAYHQGNGCNNLYFLVDSGSSTQTVDINPKWSPVLTHVLCVPYAGTDALSTASPNAPIPNLTTRQTSFDALVCSPDINPGPCFTVPASGSCTDLPANIDHKVRTIYQNRGSYCEYFSSDDCRNRLGYSDASRESKRITVPAPFGDSMGSALCVRSSFVGKAEVEGEEVWAGEEFGDETEA